MADIFLSYSSLDRHRILPLVKALETQGWSVWWDRKIPPGKTYDRVIEEALAAARCVVVVWSTNSVSSDWVKAEAAEGADRNALVPVSIDKIKSPLAYRLRQSSQLADWDGISTIPELELLFESIKELIDAKQNEAATDPVERGEKRVMPVFNQADAALAKSGLPRKVETWKLLVGAVAILTAVVTLGWAILSWRQQDAVRRQLILDEAERAITRAQAPAPTQPFIGEEKSVFDNTNIEGVLSNPTNPTEFTISESTYLTSILNYHYYWNDSHPRAQPTDKAIKLRRSDGTEFGGWPVLTGSGQNKTPDANWVCTPQVILPPGTYTILDPDPASWSQNNASGNRGMSRVRGIAVAKTNPVN